MLACAQGYSWLAGYQSEGLSLMDYMVLTATCFQGLKAMGTFLRVGTWFYFQCAVLGHSVVSNSVTLWTVAHQAPLSTGFSRQEYWSGLPCPPPWDLPNPGIKPMSPPLQGDSLLSEPPGKPLFSIGKRISHLLLLSWLCQSLWLCRSQ